MRWSLLILAGCGGSFGAPDARISELPGPPEAGVCATTCGGVCVDLETDPMHCGSCVHACPSELPACVHQTCQLADQTLVALHFGGASVTAVAVDPSGDLYATGTLTGTVDLGGGPLTSAGATDIFVASFTSAGAHRWSKVFGGTGADRGAGISLGDRVYVAGSFTGNVTFGAMALASAGGTDIFELELDPVSGDAFMARRYGTPNDDTAHGIAWSNVNQYTIVGAFGAGALDFGGAQVSGTSTATGFIATFGPDGTVAWAHRVDGTAPPFTSAVRAVAIDPSGNVVIGGEFSGNGDLGFGNAAADGVDAFVASYASFGSPVGPGGTVSWAHTFGGAGDDRAIAVAADGAGNVFVGGAYHGSVDFGLGTLPSAGTTDGFLVGYSKLGKIAFSRHLGAATSSKVTGLASAQGGGVIATGELEGAADFGTGPLAPLGMTDIFIAGFGGVASTFARRFGGADLDAATALAAGPAGYFTVGGTFRGTADLGSGPLAGVAGDNGFVMVIAP